MQLMTTKLRPSELGCGLPYRLTYCGQVFASPEHRALLADYLRVFQASVDRAVRYFLEVVGRGGKDQLSAYILIGPSNVPPDILKNEIWRAVMVEQSGYLALREGPDADLKVVYALAGYRVKTAIGRCLSGLIGQFGLGISDLNREKVESLFGLFPKLGARDSVATAAFRVLRGFLSSVTNAQTLAAKRSAVVAAAMARNPAFYQPFYQFCKHLGSWTHACRFYRLTRQALREKGVPHALINASQKMVMDRHREIPAWSGLDSLTDADKEMASQEPSLLALFEGSLPASEEVQEDIFRRYGKPGAPGILAKDTYFIQTVLGLFNNVEGLFTTPSDKEVFLHNIKKRGKISYHHGWSLMCRELETKGRKADPRFRRCVEFVTGELREFITCCRAVRTPSLKTDLMAWPQIPQLMADWAGWEPLSQAEGTRGNEIRVSIRLPAFRSLDQVEHKAITLPATIRGYMPLAKARLLKEQLDIKNPTRFRPDRVSLQSSVFGQETKKTYTKAQALRLIAKGEKIYAHIASENITEVTSDPEATRNLPENVKPPARVAILHYLPGGCRLGTMAIFERTFSPSNPIGWKLIKFQVPAGPKEHQQLAEKTFLIIEEDEFNFVVSNLAQRYREADPLESAKNNVISGEIKRHFGDTRYKQIAARIARICRDHKVGILFVAGGGRLVSRGGVTHPVGRFFAVSKTGNRTRLEGFLVNAALKSGIAIQCGTAKPAFFSSKETVLNGKVPSRLQAVAAFHHLKKAEFGYVPDGIAISKGRRDRLYDPKTKSSSSFVLNASWSLLLYHFNKAFKVAADQALDTLEESMLEVIEDFELVPKRTGNFQTGRDASLR